MNVAQTGPREGAAAREICAVCGSEFVPAVANQRYCPPTEEQRRRAKGQPRSRCARRAQNHEQRKREGRDTLPLTAPLPTPFNCRKCDKRVVPGQDGVAPHARTFCSRRCKRKWHKARETERKAA